MNAYNEKICTAGIGVNEPRRNATDSLVAVRRIDGPIRLIVVAKRTSMDLYCSPLIFSKC